MISSRLLKANLELQSHRTWLRSFVLRTRCCDAVSRSFSYQVLPKDGPYSERRPLPPQHSRRTPIGTAHFATKRLKVEKNVKLDQSYLILTDLRQAVQDLHIQRVATLFNSLSNKSVIKPNDFRIIAQCLHYSLRAEKRSADTKTRREQTEELVAFAEALVKDVIEGKFAPHCQAHVHLLGFFKESGVRDAGVRFWQWLEMQDDRYVSPDVYGAAIELLAVNGAPLSEMESLYLHALNRFPGNFSAYHLSPDAIVPDRAQATTLKGIPMSLLQGILTARLLRGDARNAYLALDTALRLYPDQVPCRFFQLFLEERPLLEAYTVFAIACRGGVVIPSNQFRQLLSTLRTSSNLTTPVRHAIAVRSMLSILYMYIGAGGQATQNVLNELVIAVTQFLRLKGMASLARITKQNIGLELMDIVRSLLQLFARDGVAPGLTSFNSIITNLGGFGSSKEMVGIALTDIQALRLQPNEVTRRSVLTAAGTLGDGEFVVKAWEGLVQGRADSGQFPDATDFHVLIKNATATGRTKFARLEFEKWREALPSKYHPSISAALDEGRIEPQWNEASEFLHLSSLYKEIRNVAADLMVIHQKTQQSPKIQDFRDQQLPMMLLPTLSQVSLPERHMGALYNELTTEQGLSQTYDETEESSSDPEATSDLEATPEQIERALPYVQSTPTSGASLTFSPTNIPLGTLRYENWKTVNYLLGLAKASDEVYLKIVDSAIAAGVVPPQRTLGLSLTNHETVESYGLSDVAQTPRYSRRERSKADSTEIQARRNEILRLRGRLSEAY